MDIFSLIDSPDIREHLRSIGYEFSPKDKAFVIQSCRHIDMEERHRLWRQLMDSTDDPALDVLSSVMETQRRIYTQTDEQWEDLTDEESEQLHLSDDFCFSFPCPFKPGEFLLCMGGSEDLLSSRPLRFLYSEEDVCGQWAWCEFRNAFGEWDMIGLQFISLERLSTFLHEKAK